MILSLQINFNISIAKAEKLFDMPMAEYAEFAQCKLDFEGMKRVYALYKQQKIAINNWGKILWSFLNPNQLIEGIEVYMKDFNKLDRMVSLFNDFVRATVSISVACRLVNYPSV